MEARARAGEGVAVSALFKRDDLAKNQTATERFAAGVLMLISFAGSVLFGGGGVESWVKLAPNWIGVMAAFVGSVPDIT